MPQTVIENGWRKFFKILFRDSMECMVFGSSLLLSHGIIGCSEIYKRKITFNSKFEFSLPRFQFIVFYLNSRTRDDDFNVRQLPWQLPLTSQYSAISGFIKRSLLFAHWRCATINKYYTSHSTNLTRFLNVCLHECDTYSAHNFIHSECCSKTKYKMNFIH